MLGVAAWFPMMLGVALAWELLVVALVLADYLLLLGSRGCGVQRFCDASMSLGVEAEARLEVSNRSPLSYLLQVREEAPAAFWASSRRFSLRLGAGETRTLGYQVRPRERGDHWFGALHLRASSVVGLLVRQTRVEAAQKVSVIPNVVEARKYQLLAKQNRLAHVGL